MSFSFFFIGVLGTYSAASRWSKTPPLERVYFTMYKKIT